MSKSIGNVVHPRDIIEEEGIDVLRHWVASHVIDQSSIPVAPHLIKQSAEDLKAIRNHLKFLLGYIEGSSEHISAASIGVDYDKLTVLDKWCLNALAQFHDKVCINRIQNTVNWLKYSSLFRLKRAPKPTNSHSTFSTYSISSLNYRQSICMRAKIAFIATSAISLSQRFMCFLPNFTLCAKFFGRLCRSRWKSVGAITVKNDHSTN